MVHAEKEVLRDLAFSALWIRRATRSSPFIFLSSTSVHVLEPARLCCYLSHQQGNKTRENAEVLQGSFGTNHERSRAQCTVQLAKELL